MGKIKKKFSKKFLIVFIIVSLATLLYIHSIASLNYRENYIKTAIFMLKQRESVQDANNFNIKTKSCLKTVNYLNENDVNELGNFLYFLNEFNYKYFLCFSTLYYAVKIENYVAYRENELNTNQIKRLIIDENEKKCLLNEYEQLTSQPNHINIDLCLLNDKKQKNFCNYYTHMNKNCKCNYYHLNGTYMLDCGTKLNLKIHEYRVKRRFFFEGAHQEFAELNAGLLGSLLNLNLNLPTYLFYAADHILNHNQKQNDYHNYYRLHYANNTIRLPSDILNYFMIFYPDLWYK